VKHEAGGPTRAGGGDERGRIGWRGPARAKERARAGKDRRVHYAPGSH
jgi:hypothetical protein